MTKNLLSLLLLLFITISVSAQKSEIKIPDNSLEGQFIEVVDESNNYQDYKVIKESKINKLRKNVMDSVKNLEEKIAVGKNEIDANKNKISELTTSLNNTQEALDRSKEKENSIEVFGILTEKSTYNVLMWAIILILMALLGYFIFRFSRSHVITKDANLKLVETEMELETVRQKHLEKEQKLRRKLQDEINKNRKG